MPGLRRPARQLKTSQNKIRFGMAGDSSVFSATIDSGMAQMSGQWREGTNVYPLTLKHTDKPAVPPML